MSLYFIIIQWGFGVFFYPVEPQYRKEPVRMFTVWIPDMPIEH
jgi:hypothetical protein